jgi:nucleoside-diphosphate-sugar epimerase
MRVLVAGDRGYIGNAVAPLPRAAGHEVGGLDLGRYEGCDLGPAPGAGPPSGAGIGTVTAAQPTGCDAVVGLAALSSDPAGHLNQPGGLQLAAGAGAGTAGLLRP